MFNSVVLDVVIGLVFIYLLYSLLATIISELIATILGLRARNLREAIDRMLNDEAAPKKNKFLKRLWDTLKLIKNPKNPVVDAFYDHPEIKYLGSSGVFKTPSNFKAASFSKALMGILFDKNFNKEKVTRSEIEQQIDNLTVDKKFSKDYEKDANKKKKGFKEVWQGIKNLLKKIITFFNKKSSPVESPPGESPPGESPPGESPPGGSPPEIEDQTKAEEQPEINANIGEETSNYIRILWAEAQGNTDKFKSLLENWFDRTMENAIEWYKRKLRVITIILGFFLAWFFNADTFVIVKNLSTDKKAREQLVSMANSYIESQQYLLDTTKIKAAKTDTNLMRRMDSLMVIKNELQNDILKANTLLGIGCRLPDQFRIINDTVINKSVKAVKNLDSLKTETVLDTIIKFKSDPVVESKFLAKRYANASNDEIIITKCKDQWCYFFWLFWHHFWGFLVTAIAISLGAPFWFDLLNKIMSLRTAKKEPTDNQETGTGGSVRTSTVKRVG